MYANGRHLRKDGQPMILMIEDNWPVTDLPNTTSCDAAEAVLNQAITKIESLGHSVETRRPVIRCSLVQAGPIRDENKARLLARGAGAAREIASRRSAGNVILIRQQQTQHLQRSF
jgi:hypothetical protein